MLAAAESTKSALPAKRLKARPLRRQNTSQPSRSRSGGTAHAAYPKSCSRNSAQSAPAMPTRLRTGSCVQCPRGQGTWSSAWYDARLATRRRATVIRTTAIASAQKPRAAVGSRRGETVLLRARIVVNSTTCAGPGDDGGKGSERLVPGADSLPDVECAGHDPRPLGPSSRDRRPVLLACLSGGVPGR